MYPRINIDLSKIAHNTQVIKELCNSKKIGITAITKMVCGDYRVVKTIEDYGIKRFGDSRLENLIELKDILSEKWLIRSPMLSEAEETVHIADASINTELRVLERLNLEAGRQHKTHKVILAMDLGDLREGFFTEDDIDNAAQRVMKMEYLQLYGISTNLGCLSFIEPDINKMQKLADIARRIQRDCKTKLEIVSGGNSTTINLVRNGLMPDGINNLRLGESILFGRERETFTRVKDTFIDTFLLSAEIIEIKSKPSLPIGTIGTDSFGRKPEFKDEGIRIRAILAVGKQDIDIEASEPVDKSIKIIGGSGDHTVVDITDCSRSYNVGDVIDLILYYPSALKAMTSKYVEKNYIH